MMILKENRPAGRAVMIEAQPPMASAASRLLAAPPHKSQVEGTLRRLRSGRDRSLLSGLPSEGGYKFWREGKEKAFGGTKKGGPWLAPLGFFWQIRLARSENDGSPGVGGLLGGGWAFGAGLELIAITGSLQLPRP